MSSFTHPIVMPHSSALGCDRCANGCYDACQPVDCGSAPSWHRQIDGKCDELSDAWDTSGYAAIATPATSAQVAKAWGGPDPEVGGSVVVSATGEKVGELVMGGKEALNVPRRLEPLHDPLSSSSCSTGFSNPKLAGVIHYTHYSLMVFGYTRIPIVAWLRECPASAPMRQIG